MIMDAGVSNQPTDEHSFKQGAIWLVFISTILLSFSNTSAQTTTHWGGNSSDWLNASNWDAGVPTITTSTTIISNGPSYPLVPRPWSSTDSAGTSDLIVQSNGKLCFDSTAPYGSLVVHGTLKLLTNGSLWLGLGRIFLKDSAALQGSGVFQAGSGSITLEGSSWDIKSGATFNAGTSTAILQGTTNQTLTGDITFYNLIINTPATVTLSGNISVAGNLNVGAGATVVVPAGKSLTVAGTVTNYGTITGDGTHPLPVEMNSLSVTTSQLKTQIRWSTATETNNFGFDIERRSSTVGWGRIGFVPGAGTSVSVHLYTYTDNVQEAGVYTYRVKQIDKDGQFKYSSVVEVEVGSVAKVLWLGTNYPNPFNPTTSIEFTVPNDGRAILKVYNIIGQEVATLFDGVATAGTLQKATFDASRLPSGVYFSRMEFGDKVLVRRIMLLK